MHHLVKLRSQEAFMSHTKLLTSLTENIAASRCTYAFARDGAIPGSQLWARVDKRFQIPLWGLVLSTVIDCILGCVYFGSSAAFNAFTGVATICLSCSYGIPILVSLIRGRKAVRHSTFSLGKFGFAINIVTVIWIFFAIILFCMPNAIPVSTTSMNYASVVFVFFAAVSVIWYIISGRKNFTGPPVPADLATEHVGRTLDGEEFGRVTTEGDTRGQENALKTASPVSK